MATRTFGSFSFEDVQDLFNIRKQKQLPLLTEWTSIENIASISYHSELKELKNELLDYILEWNEDELKLFFIGPILRLAHLNTAYFKPFSQRTLSTTINEITVSGRVDFMIAKGLKTAKPPYFCIHEYKQELPPIPPEGGEKGDPLGQVLIAMLAAQTLNENKFPILGAYIVGRN